MADQLPSSDQHTDPTDPRELVRKRLGLADKKQDSAPVAPAFDASNLTFDAFKKNVDSVKVSRKPPQRGDSFGANVAEGFEIGGKQLLGGFAYASGEVADILGFDEAGKKTKRIATAYSQDVPEADNSVGQFIGSLIPSTIPSAIAILASGGALAPLAMAGSMSTLGVSSAGMGMMEYESYKQNLGQEVDPVAKFFAGLAYGTVEMASERFSLGKLMPNFQGGKILFKGNSKVAERAGKTIFEEYAKSNPTVARKILERVAIGMNAEGMEEIIAEVGQSAVNLTYQENNDRLETIKTLPQNLMMAYTGGAIMGGALGTMSYGVQNKQHRERRKANGFVMIGQDKDTGEAYEIVSVDNTDPDSPATVLDKYGEIMELPVSQIGATARLNLQQFDKLVQNGYDESMRQFTALEEMEIGVHNGQPVAIIGQDQAGDLYVRDADGERLVQAEQVSERQPVTKDMLAQMEGIPVDEGMDKPIEALVDPDDDVDVPIKDENGDYIFPNDPRYDQIKARMNATTQEVEGGDSPSGSSEQSGGNILTVGKGKGMKKVQVSQGENGEYNIGRVEMLVDGEPTVMTVDQMDDDTKSKLAKELSSSLKARGLKAVIEPQDPDNKLSPLGLRIVDTEYDGEGDRKAEGKYRVQLDGTKVNILRNKDNKPLERQTEDYVETVADFFEGAIEDYGAQPKIMEEDHASETFYLEEVASRGENPIDLADAYLLAMDMKGYGEDDGMKERAIANLLSVSKIPKSDLQGRGIDNNILFAQYTDPKASTDLAQYAEILSRETGQEITTDDILDFIKDNPGGAKSFLDQADPTVAKIEDRFKEVTGQDLSPELARRIMNAYLTTGLKTEGVRPEGETEQIKDTPDEKSTTKDEPFLDDSDDDIILGDQAKKKKTEDVEYDEDGLTENDRAEIAKAIARRKELRETKEPHEMTLKEFKDASLVDREIDGAKIRFDIEYPDLSTEKTPMMQGGIDILGQTQGKKWRSVISKAHDEGKVIPQEVLDEYNAIMKGRERIPDTYKPIKNKATETTEEISPAESLDEYLKERGMSLDEAPIGQIKKSWEDLPIIKAIREWEKETGFKYSDIKETGQSSTSATVDDGKDSKAKGEGKGESTSVEPSPEAITDARRTEALDALEKNFSDGITTKGAYDRMKNMLNGKDPKDFNWAYNQAIGKRKSWESRQKEMGEEEKKLTDSVRKKTKADNKKKSTDFEVFQADAFKGKPLSELSASEVYKSEATQKATKALGEWLKGKKDQVPGLTVEDYSESDGHMASKLLVLVDPEDGKAKKGNRMERIISVYVVGDGVYYNIHDFAGEDPVNMDNPNMQELLDLLETIPNFKGRVTDQEWYSAPFYPVDQLSAEQAIFRYREESYVDKETDQLVRSSTGKRIDAELYGVKNDKPYYFSTGARNTEPSMDFGSTYGQDIEPAGIYFVPDAFSGGSLPGWTNHRVDAQKVKVVEIDMSEPLSWKKVLSEEYDGLTGEDLSKALVADGYDAIVSVDKDTREMGEAVDLKPIIESSEQESTDLTKAEPQLDERQPERANLVVRWLNTLSGNRPIGYVSFPHTGTVESKMEAVKKIDRYVNDFYPDASFRNSPNFVTGETGAPIEVINPNMTEISELFTKGAEDMYGAFTYDLREIAESMGVKPVDAEVVDDSRAPIENSGYVMLMLDQDNQGIKPIVGEIIKSGDILPRDQRSWHMNADGHITMLGNVDPNNGQAKLVRDHVRRLMNSPTFVEKLAGSTVKLTGIEVFTQNEGYDVVVATVDPNDGIIKEIRDNLANTFGTETEVFEDWMPHVTLEYVKKGEGSKYLANASSVNGVELDIFGMTFSSHQMEVKDEYYYDQQLAQIEAQLREDPNSSYYDVPDEFKKGVLGKLEGKIPKKADKYDLGTKAIVIKETFPGVPDKRPNVWQKHDAFGDATSQEAGRTLDYILEDADNGVTVATDGHILVRRAFRGSKSRLVDPKTGKKVDETPDAYPNYQAVIPKTEDNQYRMDLTTQMIHKVMVLERIGDFIQSDAHTPVNAIIGKSNGQIMAVNASLLARAIRMLQTTGGTNYEIQFQDSGNRALMIFDKDNPTNMALVMPVMTDNILMGTVNAFIVEDAKPDLEMAKANIALLEDKESSAYRYHTEKIKLHEQELKDLRENNGTEEEIRSAKGTLEYDREWHERQYQKNLIYVDGLKRNLAEIYPEYDYPTDRSNLKMEDATDVLDPNNELYHRDGDTQYQLHGTDKIFIKIGTEGEEIALRKSDIDDSRKGSLIIKGGGIRMPGEYRVERLDLDTDEVSYHALEPEASYGQDHATYRSNEGSYVNVVREGSSGQQMSMNFDKGMEEGSMDQILNSDNVLFWKNRLEWEENRHWVFGGTDKIQTPDEIAFLFKDLSDQGIEHTFMFIVDENDQPHIQYLSSGTSNMSPVHMENVMEGVARLNPKRMVFVHNHPTGKMEASSADVGIVRKMRALTEDWDADMEALIINADSNKYLYFYGTEGMQWHSTAQDIPALLNEKEYPAKTASKMARNNDGSKTKVLGDVGTITSPDDLANAFYSVITETPAKTVMFVLDNGKNINAVVEVPKLPSKPLSKYETERVKLKKFVYRMYREFGGKSVAFASNDPEQVGQLKDLLNFMEIVVDDIVITGSERGYNSARDGKGKIFEDLFANAVFESSESYQSDMFGEDSDHFQIFTDTRNELIEALKDVDGVRLINNESGDSSISLYYKFNNGAVIQLENENYLYELKWNVRGDTQAQRQQAMDHDAYFTILEQVNVMNDKLDAYVESKRSEKIPRQEWVKTYVDNLAEQYPNVPSDVLTLFAERRYEADQILGKVPLRGLHAHDIRNLPVHVALYNINGLAPGLGELSRINKEQKNVKRGSQWVFDKDRKKKFKKKTKKTNQKDLFAGLQSEKEALDEKQGASYADNAEANLRRVRAEWADPININETLVELSIQRAEEMRQKNIELKDQMITNIREHRDKKNRLAPIKKELTNDSYLESLAKQILPTNPFAMTDAFAELLATNRTTKQKIYDAFRSMILADEIFSELYGQKMGATGKQIVRIAVKGVPELAETYARSVKPEYRVGIDHLLARYADEGLISDEEYDSITSTYDVSHIREEGVEYESDPQIDKVRRNKSKILGARQISDKVPAKPAVLYRGENDGKGTGVARYGRAHYSTTNRSYASGFGEVIQVDPDLVYPENPLHFDTETLFEEWEQDLMYNHIGIKRASQLKLTLDQVVQELGHDGILIGSGKDMVVVSYRVKNLMYQRLDDPDGADAPLIAVHNISPAKIRQALKIGGLAMPSFAVFSTNYAHNNYGSISLIAHHSLIDPQNKDVEVFMADAYTPTFPQVQYDEENVDWKYLEEEFGDIAEEHGSTILGEVQGRLGTKPEYVLFDSHILMASYLKTIGVEAKPIYKKFKAKNPIWLEALKPFFDEYGLDPLTSVIVQDPQFLEGFRRGIWHMAEIIAEAEGGNVAEEARYLLNRLFEEDGRARKGYVSTLYRDYYKAYNDVKEVDLTPTRRKYRDLIDQNGGDGLAEAWIYDLYDKINVKKVMYAGTHPVHGNPVYKPYGLKNAVQIMKKQPKVDVPVNGGLAPRRASVTPTFKSIQHMRDEKGRLVTTEELKEAIEEMEIRMADLSKRLGEYVTEYSGRDYDTYFSYFIVDIMNKGLKGSFDETYTNVPTELRREAYDFVSDLKNMPTEYFEPKIYRAVDLHEFEGALVNKNVDQATIDLLKDQGIEVHVYDETIEGQRQKEMEKFKDLLFQRQTGGIEMVNPVKAKYIADTLKEQIKDWKMKDNIFIAEKKSELPEHIIRMIDKDGGKLGGLYWDGVAYVLAYNHTNTETAKKALLHEAMGHLGIRGLLHRMADGDRTLFQMRLTDLVNEVHRQYHKDPMYREIYAKYKKKYATHEFNQEMKEEIAQEYIAHLAENGKTDRGILQKFKQWIRQALRKMGFKLTLSDADLYALISDAHRLVKYDRKHYELVE